MMFDTDALLKYLPLLVPIMLIEMGLLIFALLDLLKRPEEQLKGSKTMWLLIVVLVNIIGPIVYFALGRKDE
ncbi:MAG: PLD nuclease N-terminal domain-containing protein [Anaerolineae bacterium]|nr:PLD nuclease N-terminal domain-containing protein [Anaerolineae bacterium]